MNDLKVLKSLRKDILLAAYKSGEGHVPSAFSILELIFGFYKQLHSDRKSLADTVITDKFVLSKGHGALALYAVLSEFGYFSKDWVENFAQEDSLFGGHPDWLKVPGVEASTGSLGHGIGIAAGMAYAQKIQGNNSKIFCLIGDGELNEGTVWETCLVANHHKLSNFIVLVDQNHSSDRAIKTEPLQEKFRSFGFLTKSINGNNFDEVKAIYADRSEYEAPRAIIAETIKGFGIKEIENNPEWHHKTPDAKTFESFMDQLK
jgi:transketolase